MEQFKPPGRLKLEGNTSENWKRWKQRFEQYLRLPKLIEEMKKFKLLFCSIVSGRTILRSLTSLDLMERGIRKRLMWC